MGRLRAGLLLLLLPVAMALVACSLLVDTSGLAGGADADGGTDATAGGGDGQAADAAGGDAAALEASVDGAPATPCVVPLVQAVPGTSVYQVMQNTPTAAQTINE